MNSRHSTSYTMGFPHRFLKNKSNTSTDHISLRERTWQNWWEEIAVADAHLDLAFDLAKKRAHGRQRVLEQDYLEDFRKAHISLVISSLYVENQFLPEMALRQGLIQLEALLSDVEESPQHFQIVSSKAQLLSALEAKRIAILISFEGIEPIHQDLNMLNTFSRLGLRGVGICWARRNQGADGSFFQSCATGNSHGLTDFGRELLRSIDQQLPLYLDLAHINDAGFEEAISLSKKPPMVSHTNCRSLNPTMRNLTDGQIQSLLGKDGFLGVNAMNFTVSEGSTIAENIQGYCDHIDYICGLGGENNLGFGFDFNDQILGYIPQEQLNLLPRKPFDCVKGYPEVELVLQELKNRGYTKEQLQKISSQNLIHYLMQVLPEE